MADSDNNYKKSSNAGNPNDRAVLADPYIGFEIDGTYLITELLGSGGWGNVYKATHMQDGTELAIKIVHKHHLQDDLSIKRFALEAKLLSRVESPYVVKIIEHGFLPAPYIVMEYFEGTPLNKWLKLNGPMNSQMAINLFLQLCDGLRGAESIRIVHRDLKPANILLRTNGVLVQSKILDFGLAKFVDQATGTDKLTSTGEILGSPPYMSPEQWKGQCDTRSDIYALGCIMYEVLSGRAAFTAQYGIDYMNKHLSEKPRRISEVNLREQFPPALEEIISKCMQKAPANRYQTSAACIADLKKVKIGRKPLIFLAEDAKLKNAKWILIAAVLCVSAIASAIMMKTPIIHALSEQLYAQADSKLAVGQLDDALSQYRQILSLSQMLPAKDMQKLHALRTVDALLKERKEFTSSESMEKQINGLIGTVSSNPELSMLLRNIESTIPADNLGESEKQYKNALSLAASTSGKNSMSYATCLDSLGTVAFKKKSYDESVSLHREALSLAEQLLEPNSPSKGDILDHLSAALTGAGQIGEAKKYSALSLALKNNNKSTEVSAASNATTTSVAPNTAPGSTAQNAASSSMAPNSALGSSVANTAPGSTAQNAASSSMAPNSASGSSVAITAPGSTAQNAASSSMAPNSGLGSSVANTAPSSTAPNTTSSSATPNRAFNSAASNTAAGSAVAATSPGASVYASRAVPQKSDMRLVVTKKSAAKTHVPPSAALSPANAKSRGSSHLTASSDAHGKVPAPKSKLQSKPAASAHENSAWSEMAKMRGVQ